MIEREEGKQRKTAKNCNGKVGKGYFKKDRK